MSATARYAPIVCVFVLMAALSGCAGNKMKTLMPEVATMQVARQYFGEPATVKDMPDGTVHAEWVRGQAVQVPGQYVTQRIYVGHDSDGFREYVEREVFVPWHLKGKFCRLLLITDKEGNVLQSFWEGTDCNAMAEGKPAR